MPKTPPPTMDLALALWAAGVAFEARLAAELAPLGMTVASFRLIGEVAQSPDGIRQGDLAARLGVKAPTVSAALARLERAHLVCRVPDPDDPRAKRVRLADGAPLHHGHEVLDRIDGELVDAVGASGAAHLVALLTQLRDALQPDPSR